LPSRQAAAVAPADKDGAVGWEADLEWAQIPNTYNQMIPGDPKAHIAPIAKDQFKTSEAGKAQALADSDKVCKAGV
jgi:hypothetical protein